MRSGEVRLACSITSMWVRPARTTAVTTLVHIGAAQEREINRVHVGQWGHAVGHAEVFKFQLALVDAHQGVFALQVGGGHDAVNVGHLAHHKQQAHTLVNHDLFGLR